MRPAWLWDQDISLEEIQAILKDPHHERFVNLAALLLSRTNTPKEVFAQYLDRTIFIQNWARIKRQMRKDSWNDPRIVFWQAVYEKLVDKFKERGIALRPRREEGTPHELTRQVAQKIKSIRQSLGLTQGELAERIGISQQIISRIERGHNDMRLLTLEKIVQGLGKEVSVELK